MREFGKRQIAGLLVAGALPLAVLAGGGEVDRKVAADPNGEVVISNVSGSVASSGAGQVVSNGTYTQGNGTTSGNPVLVAAGNLTYTGGGASAVTLATSYAFGDVFGLRHSLHRGVREAKLFYASYTGMVALAAAIVGGELGWSDDRRRDEIAAVKTFYGSRALGTR